jgi:Kef-type K+ transport system membrane component KefB
MPESPGTRRTLPTTVFYALMLAAAVGLFLLIQRAGMGITAPAPGPGEPLFDPQHTGHKVSNLLHVLLALPVIIITARLLGAVFRRLGQPPVIGEVIAGIMLGPSLLGQVWPQGAAYLLPGTAAPYLQIIAQIGVILFMFLVGLELNTQRLRHHTRATIAISHASIVVPFLLGSALALWLYPRFSSSDVPFTVFALFMGVSMSVTAFPVLARILTDRGIHTTPLGILALTCAAVDDVSAWCLLAFTVSIARAREADALTTLGLVIAFVVGMVWIVRPALAKLVARTGKAGHLTQDVIALVVVALLLSALTTEAIGIHALFGSFLVGAIIAHDSLIAKELSRRFTDIVVVLFLPAFFAYTGMRTQIGLLGSVNEWLTCGLIVAVACLGKFGGSTVAGRFAGMSWRGAGALGVLMNTRGLMELIVLNIGLDLGVLSPKLFAMLVIMAVVTTLLTSPVLHLLTRGRVESVTGDSIRMDA